jgi:hypothetical protein
MATGKEIRAKLKEEARKRARLRSMEERQAKKTAVSGTMQGKQVDTTMGPNMSQVNKPQRKKLIDKMPDKRVTPPKPEGNIASRVDNSDNTRIGPNMNQVNKPDAKSTPAPKKEMTMMEKAKDIIGVGREATEKEKIGRALQDNARKSMGMKKGGKVYCKDGCAVRGKTKGKLY